MTAREGTAPKGWVDRILGLNGWLVFLFLYAPILVLVLFSFSGDRNVGTWGGFSMEWYQRMFANGPLMQSLRNSVVVALISTVVSTVLGTAAAIALERYRRWATRNTFDISAVPVLDNGKAVGIVNEGDLVRRAEIGTASRPRSWWLNLFRNNAALAEEYTREHSTRIADVMTREV